MSRRARFRAALGLAQLSASQWAAEHNVTAGHLSLVVCGKRESQRLTEKIDAFIAKQFAGETWVA